MKDLIKKHESCIRIINLIIEGERTLEEMAWSNDRNNEMGLIIYHSENDIKTQIRAIEMLQARYDLLTSKL